MEHSIALKKKQYRDIERKAIEFYGLAIENKKIFLQLSKKLI
jgi:hypothetical protein